MKSILVIFAFIYAVSSLSTHERMLDEWKSFKVQHGKRYEVNEDEARLMVFLENRKKIAEHNRKFELGQVTYWMEMNQFGDMKKEEYWGKVYGLTKSISRTKGWAFLKPANVKVPDEVDWRKEGAVTPVKNQQHCGSCWAFSATGSLEGQLFRLNKTRLISLSEQNLVDCSKRNHGCSGGLMDFAFEYVKNNHGLDTEDSYPYEGINDRCRYDPKNSAVDVAGYVDVEEGSEDKLQAAVATAGPVAVGIEASDSFMFYGGGVFYDSECSDELNHGVLVVGYGTDNEGQQYWLVKNSWGRSWGESGYVKMARNQDNNCGIASAASYPLVK